MSDIPILYYILVCSGVTIVVRLLPFIVAKFRNKPSKVLTYLSGVMPYAMMGMLVAYGLKDVSFASVNTFVPELIACGVAVGSYLISKKTVVAIVLSTVVYMLLVQLVFI